MKWLSFITFACWWVFMIVWIIRGRGNKESVHKQSRTESRAYRIPMLLGIILSSSFPVFFGRPFKLLGVSLVERGTALFAASAAVSVLGLAIALWARSSLGRNWSYEVTLKDQHELVTSGPYATIRHPIYTAVILLVAGIVLLNPSVSSLAGLALIAWSCWIKLRQEEVLMLQQFPESYPAYMARTKRLVPGLI
ncbi:MAG: isoprenylcysteine carboxylmethyltransferase family protein [Sphingobium sp.]|nr:isoprenylcysteine carboxylmethyltransferase family protein [Sphingobium sp.]